MTAASVVRPSDWLVALAGPQCSGGGPRVQGVAPMVRVIIYGVVIRIDIEGQESIEIASKYTGIRQNTRLA